MNLKKQFAKLHTTVNDTFSKVGQLLWGSGYLVTAYREAIKFESDRTDAMDASDVEYVDISDKIDIDDTDDIGWN